MLLIKSENNNNNNKTRGKKIYEPAKRKRANIRKSQLFKYKYEFSAHRLFNQGSCSSYYLIIKYYRLSHDKSRRPCNVYRNISTVSWMLVFIRRLLILTGLLLSLLASNERSREIMESAPWFGQWSSCSRCCGCAVRFWISRICCSCCWWILLLAQWVLMVLSAVCALSPLIPLLPSPLLTAWVPALIASIQWLRPAATASQPARLILPPFRTRLQTSLKRRVGWPGKC